ncbi:hypothetical protein, partial [Pseudomonas syringae]|uniref:hypothetical protein n=1 Tax=Pseudomonas syringae TaxID=317 RepID=UPI001E57CCFD
MLRITSDIPDFLQNTLLAQAERAGPRMGRRLEDGSPKGQNLAQPGFGSRQPYPKRGQAKNLDQGTPRKQRGNLNSPAQDFLNLSGEVYPISNLAQISVMKCVFCSVQLFNLFLVVLVQKLLQEIKDFIAFVLVHLPAIFNACIWRVAFVSSPSCHRHCK